MLAHRNTGSRSQKGQSVVEYLVFFAAIAIVTLLSLTVVYPRIHQASENAFDKAAGEILKNRTSGEILK